MARLQLLHALLLSQDMVIQNLKPLVTSHCVDSTVPAPSLELNQLQPQTPLLQDTKLC